MTCLRLAPEAGADRDHRRAAAGLLRQLRRRPGAGGVGGAVVGPAAVSIPTGTPSHPGPTDEETSAAGTPTGDAPRTGGRSPATDRPCGTGELRLGISEFPSSASARRTVVALFPKGDSDTAPRWAVQGYGRLTLLDPAGRALPGTFSRTGPAPAVVPIGAGSFDSAARSLLISSVPIGPGGSAAARCPRPAHLSATLDGRAGAVLTPWGRARGVRRRLQRWPVGAAAG